MRHWTAYARLWFGNANNLALAEVVNDDDYHRVVGLWLSGRIFGRIVSITIPWRGQVTGAADDRR